MDTLSHISVGVSHNFIDHNTIGVPHGWCDAVHREMIKFTDIQVWNRFILRDVPGKTGAFKWPYVNLVVGLIKKHDTVKCYCTNGGLSTTDGHLINKDKPWQPMPHYRDILKMIAKRTKSPYQDVLQLDKCIRLKKSRFHLPNLTIRHNGRDFVFVIAHNPQDGSGTTGTWLDVTTSDDSPQKCSLQPVPVSKSKSCTVCSSQERILTKCRVCHDTTLVCAQGRCMRIHVECMHHS